MVSVIIVFHENLEYMRLCWELLKEQTFSELEIHIVDNSGENLPLMDGFNGKKVGLIRNIRNNGFAAAINQGIRESIGKYIFTLTPDVFLEVDCIERLVQAMESEPKIGFSIGKLLRYDFPKRGKTRIIDSAGIRMGRNRQFHNRGEGEEDKGQFQKKEDVFAACGAACLYRREMLEDIVIGEEYFDESFFVYKEDCDVGWRANLRGWKGCYVPQAVAYHCRRWAKDGRKKIPAEIRVHSFKNRYLLMMKNELPSMFLRDLYPILWFDIKAWTYVTLKEPFLWKVLWRVLKLTPEMLRKRKIIMNGRVSNLSFRLGNVKQRLTLYNVIFLLLWTNL